MSTTPTTRTAGALGAVGGIVLVALAGLQLADRLGEAATSALSIVAFLCLTVVPLTLLRQGATPTRTGRIGLALWAVGLLGIALAEITTQMFDLAPDTSPFYPLGGLGQLVGGLIAGVSIARAGVLDGWVRWAPLAWTLTFVVMLPFGFTESSASVIVFGVFGLVVTAASLGVAGAQVQNTDAGRTASPAV